MTIIRDKMTVLLPLKGRENFTKRWLSYHSAIGLDCKVLIGDGDKYSQVETMIDESIKSIDFDYEYKKYDDKDTVSFYKKLLSLVHNVSTPYVMLVDNDDFILPAGIKKAISFLEKNIDYVSCGGANLGIYGVPENFDLVTFPEAFSQEWINLKFIYSAFSVDQENAKDRVLAITKEYQPTWYCVHRTEVLRECLNAVLKYEIRDVYVMELFQALYMAAKGKVRQEYDCAVYMRQLNSSICAAGESNDLFNRAFIGTMVKDYQNLWAAIARVTQEVDRKHAQIAEGAIAVACIARERSEATAMLSTKSRVGKWLQAWNYVFRAKVSPYHRLMQKLEVKRVVDTIQGHSTNDDSYSPILRAELEAAFNFMKSNRDIPR